MLRRALPQVEERTCGGVHNTANHRSNGDERDVGFEEDDDQKGAHRDEDAGNIDEGLGDQRE